MIPARLVLAGCAAAFTLGACVAPGPQDPSSPDTTSSTPAGTKKAASAKANPDAVALEGILTVGAEIKPGTFKATVPADSLNCYWARLKGTSGQLTDVIANGNANPKALVTVTIKATDKAFETNGCGTWVKQK